ncbi:MAG: FxsA family protein [Pseudomonadota bacterium]|nr:FxsA family protein [Pseudomonadota bacterium]
MSRLPVWPLLALIPLAEIFLLGRVGVRLGATPLLILIVVTGLLGLWLLRRAGRPALRSIRRLDATMDQAQITESWEKALLFIAGGLLVLPGPLSDLAGLTLVWPDSRKRLAGWIARRIVRFMPARSSGRVVEGEVLRKSSRRP